MAKRNKDIGAHKNLYTSVPSSSFHSSRKVEITQVFIDKTLWRWLVVMVVQLDEGT